MSGMAVTRLTPAQKQLWQRLCAASPLKAMLEDLKTRRPRIDMSQKAAISLLHTSLYFVHKLGYLPESTFYMALFASLSIAHKVLAERVIPLERLALAYTRVIRPDILPSLRDRPELFDETVLPSFLGNFADVERAVLRVLNHQPRPYELGAVVQAYLSMIDVSWSYTEETLQTAAVLIYDIFATSLPTDYQIVELAVALVQRVADINEHPPVLLSDAHKSALCKCYRSRCELTEERYADICEKLRRVQADAAQIEEALERAELEAQGDAATAMVGGEPHNAPTEPAAQGHVTAIVATGPSPAEPKSTAAAQPPTGPQQTADADPSPQHMLAATDLKPASQQALTDPSAPQHQMLTTYGAIQVPTRLYLGNHYEKGDKLGRGTFGVVYKGVHKKTGKEAALKDVTLFSNQGVPVSIIREANNLREFNHPNIAYLEDVLYGPEKPLSAVFVFPLAKFDLWGWVEDTYKKGKTITESKVKAVAKELFKAVRHVHSRGIVHRDIKGGNILMAADGTVLLADFGLSRLVGDGFMTPKQGTPIYMAPEVLYHILTHGNPDSQYSIPADMWSVGCVIIELSTGKRFRAPPQDHGLSPMDLLDFHYSILEVPEGLYVEYQRDASLPEPLPNALWTWLDNACDSMGRPRLTFPLISLLEEIMVLDPLKRITASKALKHRWFHPDTKPVACDKGKLIAPSPPPPPALPAIEQGQPPIAGAWTVSVD